MEVKELRPFKLWVLQNFPFIEEDFDALTNYEMMCKIVGKLNEIVDITNEQTETFKELEVAFKQLKDYVDEHIEDVSRLEHEIELINNTLDELVTKVNTNTNNINSLNNKVNENYTTLNTKIINDVNELDTTLRQLINDNFNILKTYVDYNDAILDEKIENIQIGLIKIYDPTSGTIQPLQIVINNLYQLTNKDGLTASEFDALDLTCTAFENYQITAYEFDSSGKLILI